MGFWGYELAIFFEKIRFRKKQDPGIPLLHLGFYRELIVFDHKNKKYFLVAHDKDGKNKNAGKFDELKKYFNGTKLSVPLKPFTVKKFKPGISQDRFEKMVRKAKAYIEAGDIYQANISQRFSFEFSGSPLRLYDFLRKINPSPFSSFLQFGEMRMISSSPERLVSKKGRVCETRPIAGTCRRKGGRFDRQMIRDLLANEKEQAEHIMLVDLERNDLGRVCDYKSVRVEEMMTVEKYSHVLHIVSKITGKLSKNKDGLDLIRALFPGGTITGCPKIRCMEIIDELEPVQRGPYTGSIGYIDFSGDLDLNIIIRTVILKKDRGFFQVGAGIVYDSDPQKEYEETLHKGEALAEALAQARLK